MSDSTRRFYQTCVLHETEIKPTTTAHFCTPDGIQHAPKYPWRALARSWGALGASFGCISVNLGALGRFGALLAALGTLWAALVVLLAALWAPVAARRGAVH